MAGRSAGRLLRGLDGLLDDVAAGRRLGRHGWGLALRMAAGAALYGAVFGGWHGPRLAAYVALKLPLVLLLTSALTLLFSWLAARLLGLPLRFAQVAVLIFLGLAVAAVLLASLTPVAWLFIHCAPAPAPEARTAHNLLYLMHTLFVGGCGLAGTAVLWRAMRRLDAPRRLVRGVFVLWLATYALVGGEVAWVLRPFVGSVYAPVHFLRRDALDGNVYEFVFTDILPHLADTLFAGLDDD
jgi:hypothetical protein